MLYGELSHQQQLQRDQSTRRILAVGAGAADPRSCWWWRCCCCCVSARLGVEQKLAVPINGRECKHRSGINVKMKRCLYVRVVPTPNKRVLAFVTHGQTRTHVQHSTYTLLLLRSRTLAGGGAAAAVPVRLGVELKQGLE